MKLLNRRKLLVSLPAVCIAPTIWAQGPLEPFLLRVVRDNALPQTLSLSDCITGKLYVGSLTPADPGTLFCRTLELPYRGNQNKISAIKTGLYSAKVRDDGHLGWRIELLNTTPRTVVEIHVGNRPPNTEGCILLGKTLGGAASITGAPGCAVGSSVAARDELMSLYGGNPARPIRIEIE